MSWSSLSLPLEDDDNNGPPGTPAPRPTRLRRLPRPVFTFLPLDPVDFEGFFVTAAAVVRSEACNGSDSTTTRWRRPCCVPAAVVPGKLLSVRGSAIVCCAVVADDDVAVVVFEDVSVVLSRPELYAFLSSVVTPWIVRGTASEAEEEGKAKARPVRSPIKNQTNVHIKGSIEANKLWVQGVVRE